VNEILQATKTVIVSISHGGKPPKFQGSGGEIHSRIAQEMRAVLHDDEEPVYVDHNGRVLLRAARQVARAAGLLESDILIRRKYVQWFPWTGTRGLRTLALHAKAADIRHEIDGLSIKYKFETCDHLFEHLRSIVDDRTTATELAALLRVKTFEKFDGVLSDELLDVRNGRDHLCMESARGAAFGVLTRLRRDGDNR
jgi:ATP-dependent Lhr-like helicase